MRTKAFSLVELLMYMVIIGIVGGIAVAALWFVFGAHSQMDDYTAAEGEMSYAVQRLSREFAMIGLGMPNNRKGLGSFALTFRFTGPGSTPPIMALMGDGSEWGGPVTVASANNTDVYDDSHIARPAWRNDIPGSPKDPDGNSYWAFVGPELYYAWGIPTGVKAKFSGPTKTASNYTPVTITPLYPPNASATGGDYLRDIRYDGRSVGVPAAAAPPPSENTNSWMLFTTLRLPMFLQSWESNKLEVQVAPEDSLDVEGTIMGLDEIHLIQAARLYRRDDKLMRVIFDSNPPTTRPADPNNPEPLANNIVGLQFVYYPVPRLLTMYIAARGNERPYTGAGQTTSWPSWLPEQISAADARYRIVVKALTWRIRN